MAIYVIPAIVYLLLTIFLINNGSCSDSGTLEMDMLRAASSANERLKRKVADLDVASGPLEYLAELREKYSDSDGRPTMKYDDDPTSVWCIMDRDMLEKAYRPRPEPSAKCTVQNRFIFNWGPIAEDQSEQGLPVQKAIIRAYLKPIPRLLRTDPTPVDIDIRVGLLGERSTVEAGSERVEVTTTTSWLELDVAKGVKSMWPPQTQNTNLEFTINLSVNCKDIKKVPAIFIDPTEIKLSNARRRQRHEPFQPFLLVFFSDKEVVEIVRNETLSISQAEEEHSEDFSESNTGERQKRSAPSCYRRDFPVVFRDLHLNYVLIPAMYNAYQCAGSCSHQVLTTHHQLGTNHANIMAGAYAVLSNSQRQAPAEPCCVPTRYSSLSMIVVVGGILDYKVYPAMIVNSCGCR